MDLTVSIGEVTLNIRVTILLKTKWGYVLEKDSKEDFYFPIGGRVQGGEKSAEAAIREVKEELHIDLDDLRFKGILENFFTYDSKNYHELNFMYEAIWEDELNLDKEFHFFAPEDLSKIEHRPGNLRQIIEFSGTEPFHMVLDDRGDKSP